MAHLSDQRLKRGQVLTENWEIKYEGIDRRGPVSVRAMLAHWPHTTYYASSVEAETVDEARLMLVLQQARAICDDEMAFTHDADEIANSAMLRWFKSKISEENDYFEAEEDPKQQRKIKRRISVLEQLMAEWQEDNDYWPEEADEHEKKATCTADRKAVVAALAASRAGAEAERARESED